MPLNLIKETISEIPEPVQKTSSKFSSNRKFIAIQACPKKQKKISNKQLNLTPKELEKEQAKPKPSSRKEKIKSRVDIDKNRN